MKKVMMMAMMLVASATAFAGDSDALKAILKAKTYAEASALLNNSLSSLANDAEKAKAYNKLVDLAMEQFEDQNAIKIENQMAAQMGKGEKPVDEALMSEMAYNALIAAQECDKYDQKPNEKGKIAPKFAEKNAQRLWVGPRNQLVNAGQEAASAQDNASARKYWELFTLSNEFPLFQACDREAQKSYFGQVARYATIFAFQDKDMQKALELVDIVMKVPEEYDNALNLKMEILGSGLQSKEDSINYINKLKDVYAEHKTDVVMAKLYDMLLATGEKGAAVKILDDALAVNPDNSVALANKGYGLINENAAEAVKYLKRAAELKPDNASIQTYAGTALSVLAQNTEDRAAQKDIYKEAIGYYDRAKELDPNMVQVRWGYNRYNAYYNYYGADAPETKEAELDSK